MTTEPLLDLELVVSDTNALAVADKDRAALIETLKPIADTIANAQIFVRTINVNNEQEAKDAAVTRDKLIEYAHTAETALREFDGNLVERLYRTHRAWTALIGRFAVLNDLAREIKQKIMLWQAMEAERAERERARLQSILDEQARAERERLEKQAAKLKTPALKEQRLEQAAAIVPSVVQVAAPPKAVKSQTRWKVKAFDMTAMGIPKEVQGYLTVETSRLERAKAANAMLVVSGVEFHTVLC